jgi:hypothetical protein
MSRSSTYHQLNEEEANRIGSQWIRAWNYEGVEDYIEQYTEDATLVSSIALRLFPDSKGKIKGKSVLYQYWSFVREIYPNLKFQIERILFQDHCIMVFFFSNNQFVPKGIARLEITTDEKISRAEISHV